MKVRFLTAALLATGLAASSPIQAASRQDSGAILHTAILGSYGYWLGQDSELDNKGYGYGATIRYMGGSQASTRLGVGVNWVRNRLKVDDTYRANGRTFTDDLTMRRLGMDLYYGLPANTRGNVPYFLAGGGRLTTKGDTVGDGSVETGEGFWEVGMGMINGGSGYTAFALELKYIGTMGKKIRSDNGLIELSMSIGYNW
jgi:hypothetical protein